jgi:hypothetical protein
MYGVAVGTIKGILPEARRRFVLGREHRTAPAGPAPSCSARGRLAGLGIERGVHHLDQIALHGRGLVLDAGESDDDLERVFGGAAIEQHARSRVSEHARMGFDDGADVFQRRLKLGPLRDREAHLGT